MATLDKLQAQLDKLTQRVNEITAPPDDYYTHRFSGEEIDNAVDRVKATPGSGAITAGDIGAAPSGFGLGTDNPPILNTIDSVDAFTNSGWATVRLTDGNFVANISANGTLFCSAGFAYKLQSFVFWYAFYGGYVEFRRIWYENTWKEWEWVKPPLFWGQEYKTTERYNGKPVYTKLCGPAHAICVPATPMSVVLNFGLKNPESILECICITGKYENGIIVQQINNVSFLHSDPLYIKRTGMDPNYVRLEFMGFDGDYGYMAKIKYTKTTD